MPLENFKQLFQGHLGIHFGWELHRIHNHLSSKNLYFDFHSILNDLLHYFEKLTLSRTPTRWGCLEAPKGCPIRKYSGECFAPFSVLFWSIFWCYTCPYMSIVSWNSTCGTHTLCVSGGAQHSPAQMQHSWTKNCMNLYVLYMRDSSRCIVAAIFPRKSNFSTFLIYR